MKIYVASSWRNEKQSLAVTYLRGSGHEVYDFKNPDGRDIWETIEEAKAACQKAHDNILAMEL